MLASEKIKDRHQKRNEDPTNYRFKIKKFEFDASKYNQDTSKYIYPKSTVTDSKVYLSDKQDIKIKYFHR